MYIYIFKFKITLLGRIHKVHRIDSNKVYTKYKKHTTCGNLPLYHR